MEHIKINVRLLGRYPGMVIGEDDKYFKDFKRWAEDEDRYAGRLICTMVDSPDADAHTEKTDENPGPDDPKPIVDDPNSDGTSGDEDPVLQEGGDPKDPE